MYGKFEDEDAFEAMVKREQARREGLTITKVSQREFTAEMEAAEKGE